MSDELLLQQGLRILMDTQMRRCSCRALQLALQTEDSPSLYRVCSVFFSLSLFFFLFSSSFPWYIRGSRIFSEWHRTTWSNEKKAPKSKGVLALMSGINGIIGYLLSAGCVSTNRRDDRSRPRSSSRADQMAYRRVDSADRKGTE